MNCYLKLTYIFRIFIYWTKYWPDKNFLKNHFISIYCCCFTKECASLFLVHLFVASMYCCSVLLFELFLMSMYWFGWKRSEQSLYKCGVWEYGKFSLQWFLYRFSNTWFNSHSYLTCYGFCCEIYLGYNLIVELFHFFSIPKDVKIDSSVCALKICFSVSYLFSLYIYAPIG